MLLVITGILGLSFVNIDNGIPVFLYWDFKFAVLGNPDVHIVSGSVVLDWACMAFPLTANYLYLCPIFFINGNLILSEFLILRLLHLVLRFKIEPQLETN